MRGVKTFNEVTVSFNLELFFSLVVCPYILNDEVAK